MCLRVCLIIIIIIPVSSTGQYLQKLAHSLAAKLITHKPAGMPA
jgi:hypothetical protein